MSTRDDLLDAWEQQFPASRMYADAPDDLREDHDWVREADEYVEQAALRLGHPAPARTVGLTRGGEAEQRIELARRTLRDVQVHGGDAGSAMRELHDATDRAAELQRLGQFDEPIELAHSGASGVYGPNVRTPWRPTR